MGQRDTRGFGRFMLAGAVEVDVDSIGRILVPEFLRDYADLRNRVVFAGVYNRIEIWNDREWSQYKKQIEKDADGMAEKLGGVGIF
jgi:MraZ protein